MDLLFGVEAEAARRRRCAHAALDRATRAIVRLDVTVEHHPLAAIWRRHEGVVALAQALTESGEGASLSDVVRLIVIGQRAHDAELRAAFDFRCERWKALGERNGGRQLRELVGGLCGKHRGRGGLVELMEATLGALDRCSSPAVELDVDIEGRTAIVRTYGRETLDAADVALATPFALRRLGVAQSLLPSLTGRPRHLNGDLPVDERIRRWADILERQATDALDRLKAIERYVNEAERCLAAQRRPQALRRAVEITLAHGRIWAAELARLTGVDIANAWRSLRQAEQLGLLVAVPAPVGRGAGRLLTVPFLLRAAGSLPVALPSRKLTVAPSDDGALAEFDQALAAVDRLLDRQQDAER